MSERDPVRTLLVTAGSIHRQPWWWNDIDHDALPCALEQANVIVENGRLQKLISVESFRLFCEVARIVFSGRRRYRYIYTFECGWLSFAIAFLQTLTMSRRPRHVILQFIMREKRPTWRSRLKYAFMRWCFSSVYLCICSSRAEARYYQQVFRWPASKFDYVPLNTNPRFLDQPTTEGSYVIAAGRTFRDYPTLIAAARTLPTPVIIVAGRGSAELAGSAPNITMRFDVPGAELGELVANSLAVAVPLEHRRISIGQSVVVQAMSLGKAVIATRCPGTEDYIEHMRTGILVEPGDVEGFREALRLVADDAALRDRLGRAARDRVLEVHLPNQYARAVADILSSSDRQPGDSVK
jgi:glycosyltransferase involved in cell wall biosynthesis